MRLLILAALLVWPALGITATAEDRAAFRDALAAARQGSLDSRPDLESQLRDYPLYDYLTAASLRHQLDSGADPDLDARIRAFVDSHPDLPPAESLRRNWLPTLAQRERWALLRDIVTEDDTTTNQCRLVNARIELGEAPVADALALWRVGRSQPDACDPVFAWLDARGQIDDRAILDRARLAVLEGQFGLVRYLGRQLPDNLRAVTDRWLNVTETPANLVSGYNGLDGDITVYAFKRLALRSLDTAANLLPRLTDALALSAEQGHEMARYVALLYAQNHESEALAWFARLDHSLMTDDAHALGWEIRAAIYHGRWPLVVDAIEALPTAIASDEEWRYWEARALDEMGRTAAARAIYEPLSRKRSYHGYLAADALERAYSLNERPLGENDGALARVRARPALARAYELRALGMDSQASQEWVEVTRGLDEAALGQAARIAHRWGWHSRAIITLARADYWDDLDIRYPLMYRSSVTRFARVRGLDPAYVLAIMRTESLFQPEIRSSANAIGLMQLLPGTARLVARRIGENPPSASALTIPEINIELGTAYLAQLRSRWNDNVALASASYNAGPGRIARWLPEAPMDPRIWIANVPYTETRNYVQRVMSHMTIFQSRLDGAIVPIERRLDTIRPAYGEATRDR